MSLPPVFDPSRRDSRTAFELTPRFAGPRTMGHGGYVAGLLAEALLSSTLRSETPSAPPAGPAVQVTLRRPTPFEKPLELVRPSSDTAELRCMEERLVDAERTTLELDLVSPPSLDQARGGEAESPSYYGGQGVHPSCFGCSHLRDPGDALRIFAGPCEVEGRPMVAAPWTPPDVFASEGGTVPVRIVLAALDCPGAFAFMVAGKRPGLLGRISFQQHRRVLVGREHLVVGWQLGQDERRLYAGTALFDARGELCAIAKATWFPIPGSA